MEISSTCVLKSADDILILPDGGYIQQFFERKTVTIYPEPDRIGGVQHQYDAIVDDSFWRYSDVPIKGWISVEKYKAAHAKRSEEIKQFNIDSTWSFKYNEQLDAAAKKLGYTYKSKSNLMKMSVVLDQRIPIYFNYPEEIPLPETPPRKLGMVMVFWYHYDENGRVSIARKEDLFNLIKGK